MEYNMNEIIKLAQNGSNLIKSLILMLLAVPVTFVVQLVFYFIIDVWVKLNKEKDKKENKNENKNFITRKNTLNLSLLLFYHCFFRL